MATVAISLDGAMLAMKEDGWREAMVGSLSLYSPAGERLQTLYVGEAPKDGKESFLQRMTREIERFKARYPDGLYLGIADGASTNWVFLERHTARQLIDYFHAAEYLPALAMAAYPGNTDKPKRELSIDLGRKQRCLQAETPIFAGRCTYQGCSRSLAFRAPQRESSLRCGSD